MQLSQLVDGHLPMLPPWNIGKCLKKCVGNGPKMGPIGSWPVSMSRGTQERRYRQYGPSLLLDAKVMRRSRCVMREMEDSGHIQLGMDQFLLIPFLVGWTSIYQLFWCSPGVQGFDTLPVHQCSSLVFGTSLLHVWNWSPTFTPPKWPSFVRKEFITGSTAHGDHCQDLVNFFPPSIGEASHFMFTLSWLPNVCRKNRKQKTIF